MYDQTGDRKLPFFEGLNLYLEKGGTKAEYFAQFLTSTREELKVFGVEVASVRRFLYGFMPSGTFRLVNLLSPVYYEILIKSLMLARLVN